MDWEDGLQVFLAMLLVASVNLTVSQCGGDYKNTLQNTDTYQYYDSVLCHYDSLSQINTE